MPFEVSQGAVDVFGPGVPNHRAAGALSLFKAVTPVIVVFGAKVDPVEFPTLGKTDDAEYEVLLYEFKADL